VQRNIIQLTPLILKSLNLKYRLYWSETKSPISFSHFLCKKSQLFWNRLYWNIAYTCIEVNPWSAEVIMSCFYNCYTEVPRPSSYLSWLQTSVITQVGTRTRRKGIDSLLTWLVLTESFTQVKTTGVQQFSQYVLDKGSENGYSSKKRRCYWFRLYWTSDILKEYVWFPEFQYIRSKLYMLKFYLHCSKYCNTYMKANKSQQKISKSVS
jgi:hypothetical protein